jgi:hypothetical protein
VQSGPLGIRIAAGDVRRRLCRPIRRQAMSDFDLNQNSVPLVV